MLGGVVFSSFHNEKYKSKHVKNGLNNVSALKKVANSKHTLLLYYKRMNTVCKDKDHLVH